MRARKPTKKMKALIDEFDFTQTYTYDDLVKLWDIREAGVRYRLEQMSLLGHPVKVHLQKRAGRGASIEYAYIEKLNLGDPALPECAVCKKMGRTTIDGKRPHYITEDEFVYCPACSNEATDEEMEAHGVGKTAND